TVTVMAADCKNVRVPQVDFAKHAESMGALAETVSSIADLEQALDRARKADRTYVISIKVHPHEWTPGDAWWDVGVPEGSAREIARLEKQLSTYAALGAPVMVYAETTGTVQNKQKIPVSQRPRIAARDFAAYGRKLTQVAEHLKRRGVPMAYHHHMGTIVENE